MLRFIFLLFASVAVGQTNIGADFISVHAELSIDRIQKSVSGKASYEFNVAKKVDTIRIDAVRMNFSEVLLNGRKVGFLTSDKQLKLYGKFKKGGNKLTFKYKAQPRQTMYFTGEGDDLQAWTQGQGKYTSHWLPSFDDVNEKLIFNLNFVQEKDVEVISNGILIEKKPVGDRVLWKYAMQQPMSSYLAVAVVGNFNKKEEKSASGVSLTMYLRPEDRNKSEPTYRYSKQMFDFLEREIGVPYPWQVYKQVPVLDFLYAGMENTSATVFAQDFVVDSVGFIDRNYVNVNAHELAHQWFGNLVTASSGKHHWLQEGFATYYALLAEKELFGDDHFNWKLYETAGMLQQASQSDSIPILNEKASSLTFYQKGAWALHALRESVGEENFRKAVKSYLQKHSFKNVVTEDFLAEIRKVSSIDTKEFQVKWLENPKFPVDEALELLKRNRLISRYLEVQQLNEKPFAEKAGKLSEILRSDLYHPIKEEVIYQVRGVPQVEKLNLLRLAMATNDVHVRQAVARSLQKVPADFYADYETLLDDRSYITREIAFGALWQQFPEKREGLLNKMDGQIGLNDKNLRIQWLTLALATKDYRNSGKPQFYDELMEYAGASFESPVRQNAIESLLGLDPNDTNALRMLINPLTHHKWQFSRFAREKIRELIKKPKHRDFFQALANSLTGSEKQQLERLLSEK